MSTTPTTSIVVLGAGVLGLSSALALIHAYPLLRVTIVSQTRTPKTTSDGAGALWRVQLQANDPQLPLFHALATTTYQRFCALIASHGSTLTGSSLCHGVEFHSQPMPLPSFHRDVISFKEINEYELKLMGINLPTAKHGFAFTSVISDMPTYLSFLEREFLLCGGEFIEAEIETLESSAAQHSSNQAAHRIISQADLLINCLGLGSKAVLHDHHCSPIRGYLVRVECPSLKLWLRNNDDWTYIFPRSQDVCLGGTYEKNEWNTDRNEQTATEIIRKCAELCPDLAHARVLNHWIGLRPHRTRLRLEMELLNDKTYRACPAAVETGVELLSTASAQCRVPIIHCYGASGSGMSISWGVAEQVLRMAEDLLGCLGESKRSIHELMFRTSSLRST